MALKLSGLFQTNVSDMHRGENVSATNGSVDTGRTQQSEAQLRELTPGQAIRGEIVGKNGEEIQIRIAKDVILNARMEQDIQASTGQSVTFEIRSNASGALLLRPLFQNMSQENNALKALAQAGIENDAKSVQMVSTMMQEGMSIGKEALQGMYREMIGVSESDVPNAVQMNRLQIPVTPENLQQFAAYKNYEHQLLNSFSQVADEIPQAVSQLFAEGEGAEGCVLIGRLLDTFADQSGENVVSGETATGGNAVIGGEIAAGGENAPGTEAVPGNIEGTEESLSEAGQSRVNGLAETEAGILQNGSADGKDTVLSEMTAKAEALQENLSEGLLTGKTESALTGTKAGESNVVLFSQEEGEGLAALVKEAGGSPEVVNLLLNGQIGKEDFYQLVRSLAEGANTPEQQLAVKELFVSEKFQTILKERIGNQWTLQAPEQLEKKEVSKLYERLNEQTRQLTQALSDAVKTDSPLFKSVQNIRENVDFMNQLNQVYTYVQLPLKMSGNSAHGDLYVYTNKKNLAKKDGNVSAFLHLDMEHLGRVDVYVAMEQSRISTNFYLEDEDSLALLEKNMDLLTKRLTDKGYKAEAKLMLRDQPGNVMEEIVATDKNISIISEQSFDVRA